MNKTKGTYLALLAVLLSPMAANAVPIEVTGAGEYDGLWDIAVLDGTFSELETTLTSQVWWGSEDLAAIFAGALGDFGGNAAHNSGLGIGAFFLHSITFFDWGGSSINYSGWSDGQIWAEGVLPSGFGTSSGGRFVLDGLVVSYATASRIAVPEPGTLALFGIGLLGMGAVRHRKKA